MYFASLLWIVLFASVQEVYLQYEEYDYTDYGEPEVVQLNCSTSETIRGGHVTYSQGGLEGSVLTYHCDPGHYPFPVSHRLCRADGEWSAMALASGRRMSQATCKAVLCPAQLQLDQGDFWPRNQWFRPGEAQSFSCLEGFTLSGSAQRNCTLSGEWTGTTPICDHHDPAEDCKDPGVPPGAQRSAGRFRKGEKLNYQCQAGLDLLGSAQRVCLENREWSGSAPRCQAPNTFDSPGVVAAAMAGSLSGIMDVLSPQFKKEVSFGRTLHVGDGNRMNIYILLDTSGSITKEDFDKSRNATVELIRKLDSYDVQMQFHVTSFASEAKDIVKITHDVISTDADRVIESLMAFNHDSHGRKTGTNLHAALQRVNEMIALFKQNRQNNHFNETQNVIIIETDGHSNTGTSPQRALAQTRQLLGYHTVQPDHTEETLLDVYVFGVGSDVNKVELNAIASKKRGEEHLFILRDYETLGEVFNNMISDQSVTMCGVAQEDISKNQMEYKLEKTSYTRPWHVTVHLSNVPTDPTCYGSIVSQNWVLTAAHCFARAATERVTRQYRLKHGEGTVFSKAVIMHPKYDIRALEHRNVSEFYDYDVALVQLNSSIPLSWKARPICLPCTVPASRAMKRINATCEEHRKELLPHKQTPAFFIHKADSKRKETHIHTEDQRPGCVEKAKLTLKEPTDVTVDEFIPERFLCSGGSTRHQDSITCKGDSGGSLFLQKRMRYFQVGVVSWGTTDVCSLTDQPLEDYTSDRPPPYARDFHINLFTIMPWLKQHLGEEIQFLPEEN